jgi:hypothetical protein
MQVLPIHKPEFYPANYSRVATDDYKKKYFLFSGSNHYPLGGWEDFRGNFVSVDEALMFLRRSIEADERNWYHVIDIDSQSIIKEFPEGRSIGNI